MKTSTYFIGLFLLILIQASIVYFGVTYNEESKLGGDEKIEKGVTTEEKLIAKTEKEKANIKADEIVKNDPRGTYLDTKTGLTIEIQNIELIEGGVQIFARAWRNGEQIGFGPDGSVEIERFRIMNPPIMVDDVNGTVVRETQVFDIETKTTRTEQRKLREDPAQAIKETLAHTISVAGQDGKNIIIGKVGNTTTTLFPVAGATSPVDGYINNNAIAAYATVRNASTGNASPVTDANAPFITNYKAGTEFYVRRSFFGFDTTIIGSDTISSATFSVAGTGDVGENVDADTAEIVSATPASNSDLVDDDFDQIGTTSYASKLVSSYSTTNGVYNDFTLDANGITYISSWSGVGFLAGRAGDDLSNTA
jgi:hypothetical protein